MPKGASADEIRVAYRDRARRFHPDRSGGGLDDDDAMARVNEAYRVLYDQGRRAEYDRSLAAADDRGSMSSPSDVDRPDVAGFDVDGDEYEYDWQPEPAHSPLSPAGPARLPWKLMLVAALIGSTVVLVAAAFTDPPSEEPPDGILRSGSCVEIEANGDAREIACSDDGIGDTIVELLLPTGARCPSGTLAHRDRLGLGTACIQG